MTVLEVEQLQHGDALLTIAEAAARLDLPMRTVRSWVDRGKLPATRWDGRLVVAESHLWEVEHATRHAAGGRPRGR